MDNNKLNVAANLSQFYSLFLLLRDASNNEIMKALQEQNTVYFERIIKELEDIKKLLTASIKNDNTDNA